MSTYLTINIISLVIMTIILIFVLISNHNKNKKKSSEEVPDIKNNSATNLEESIVAIRELKPNYTFFDDSKSSDSEKHREGSQFWITSGIQAESETLILNKNNWGSKIDYMFSDDGYVEIIITVKGEDMIRLMQLCDNAQNGNEAAEYLYKRFSPDGYGSYTNMLNWFEENNIKTSFWSWP